MKRFSICAMIVLIGYLTISCDESTASSATGVSSDSDAPIDSADAGLGDAGYGLRGPCPREQKLGALEVSVVNDFSSISGAFNNAIVPLSVPSLESEQGGCVLLRRRNPFCDPGCSSGNTCDFDGTCIPYPTQQNIGVITITGLIEPVSLQPKVPGNSYFQTDLPHPLFESGDAIRMTTTEGYFGVFSLQGRGIEPLLDTDLNWNIEFGKPLHVTWKAPGADTGSRIAISINIDQHGASPLSLSCDVPDTGTADIPASLIESLFSGGISGFPSGRLTRRSVDSVIVDNGCVELLITSPMKVNVRVVTPGQ